MIEKRVSLRDTNGKAQGTTHEGHDAVKSRKDDSNGQKDHNDHNTDKQFHEAPEIHGSSNQSSIIGNSLLMKTHEDLDGGNNGPAVQGNLCKRNDGDEAAHKNGESSWVAGFHQDVGSDFVTDTIAKHEKTCDGNNGVEDIREREGVLDSLLVLVRVSHVTVDLK